MAGGVPEHPVLIPTSLGPAGGIVCAPAAAPPRAALLLLHTGGRSGRSGFGSEWALLSRRLAGLGAVVLRYDYCKEGDSSMVAEGDGVDAAIAVKLATDVALLAEVGEWFRQRTRELDLIVVGVCYGGRLALEPASRLAGRLASLLVVPFLRPADEDNRARWRERMLAVRRGEAAEQIEGAEPAAGERLDEAVVAAVGETLGDGPAWILIGERDADEAVVLGRMFAERGLEVEVEPGRALYPGNEPDVQELVGDRIAARVGRLLGRGAGAEGGGGR